jgi:hypothetical protein
MRRQRLRVSPRYMPAIVLLGSLFGLSCAKRNMDESHEIKNDVFIQNISSYDYCFIGWEDARVIVKRSLFDDKLAQIKELLGTAPLTTFKKGRWPACNIEFYKRGSDNKAVFLGRLGLLDRDPRGVGPHPMAKIIAEWDNECGGSFTSTESEAKYLTHLKSLCSNPEISLDWLRDFASYPFPVDHVDHPQAAIWSLPYVLGENKMQAVPVLENALEKGDRNIRGAAARALVTIDPPHIAAKKYLSQFPSPTVTVEAVIEKGKVVFVIDHKNAKYLTFLKVSDGMNGDVWGVEMQFKGQKIIYGELPKGKGVTAVEKFRDQAGLPDIRGKTVKLWITYQFDGVYGAELGDCRPEVEIPAGDVKK